MEKLYRGLFAASLTVIAIFSNVADLKAGHAALFELNYRWVQDSTYEVTLIFYRNCQGFAPPAPSSIPVKATSKSHNFVQTLTTLPLPSTGPSAPPLAPPNMLNCTNNAYCYQEYVYRGNWSSPFKADDWIFSYEICCMPPSYSNISGSNNFYQECGLNNLDFPDTINQNISGVFHNRRPNIPGFPGDTIINYPFQSVCESREVEMDQSVRNYDGDRIEYSLYHPQGTNGGPISFINGFTTNDPISTSGPPMKLDSSTGVVTFKAGTPIPPGTYAVGIKATEFRNDTVLINGNPTVVEKEIGYVKRNLFITIEDSATCQDNGFGFTDSTNFSVVVDQIDLNCANNPIMVGFSFGVKCNSVDSNASSFILIDSLSGDTVNILKTLPVRCNRQGITDAFRIHLDTFLVPGSYWLMPVIGSDSNTIITECDYHMIPLQDTLLLKVADPGNPGHIIADTTVGSTTTMSVACGTKIFNLGITSNVMCSSVAGDGSDLYITKSQSGIPVALRKVTPLGCGNGKTRKLTVEALQPLSPGQYSITLKNGTDGNAFIDECYRTIDSTTTITLNVEDFEVDLGPDFTYCIENTSFDTILTVPVNLGNYEWSTGAQIPQTHITTSGTYWIKVTSPLNCLATDTVVVSAIQCTSGFEEISGDNLRIYPIPVRNQLFIEQKSYVQKLNIQIYTVSGRLVSSYESTGRVTSMELIGLKPGFYFLNIEFTNGQSDKYQIIVE